MKIVLVVVLVLIVGRFLRFENEDDGTRTIFGGAKQRCKNWKSVA
ncbi:MAG: hypothetical protein RMK49_18170 [Abditibacteriales bacterium]|nr:hypothetical protein [Abditibacteriales bacterium]